MESGSFPFSFDVGRSHTPNKRVPALRYGERGSLPPNTNLNILDTYQILKPIPIESSTIAPYWNQPGLGKQYLTPVTIPILLKRGVIIKLH